jgi:hypothetical protein
MRRLLIIVLILIPVNIFSQISGIVMDKSAGYPVQNANIRIENEEIATTSDNEGKFTFRKDVFNKTLIVSAIGFTTERIVADKEFLRIELKTRVYQMIDFFITAERSKPEFVVGKYERDSVSDWYCSKAGPWMVARYFKYDTLYEQTPRVKELTLLTDSQSDTLTFSIRLLNADNNGKPGFPILKDDLIITALKGKRDLKVDLTEFQIGFSKNGFFVVAGSQIPESNKREINNKKKQKQLNSKRCEPCFGIVPGRKSTGYWTYKNGKWRNDRKINHDKSGKPMDIAIELTLTE